jgi:hypothetical protein
VMLLKKEASERPVFVNMDNENEATDIRRAGADRSSR